MKKKITAVLLIILMLIPSAIAVWNYVSQKNGPVDSKNVISLTIDDLTGQQFVLEHSDESSAKVIDFFLDMNKNARSITALPDALGGSPFFKVTSRAPLRNPCINTISLLISPRATALMKTARHSASARVM